MTGWITIRVTGARGSTPRDVGTEMRVSQDTITGTIGGGTLEWEAIGQARRMLRDGTDRLHRHWSLGPELGQCCGGAVELEFTTEEAASSATGAPLWIWGAGHVGRAIADVMAPLADRPIYLVDVAKDRLPDAVPDGVDALMAADPVRLVPRVDTDADHLIVTYSHDLDLRLCDALLRHGFGSAGLIGSATKWARFRKRLAALGHAGAQISRIRCPIGQPELGKHPQAIAVGVASTLLSDVRHRTLGEDIAL